jgi:putative aldouronate transport system substrate-binding protein
MHILPEARCDTWAKSSVERTLPPISATPEESSQLASIMNEIYTYVDEMFVRFVQGEEDIFHRLRRISLKDSSRWV